MSKMVWLLVMFLAVFILPTVDNLAWVCLVFIISIIN